MTREQVKQLMKKLGQNCHRDFEDFMIFDSYTGDGRRIFFYFNEKDELVGVDGDNND